MLLVFFLILFVFLSRLAPLLVLILLLRCLSSIPFFLGFIFLLLPTGSHLEVWDLKILLDFSHWYWGEHNILFLWLLGDWLVRLWDRYWLDGLW